MNSNARRIDRKPKTCSRSPGTVATRERAPWWTVVRRYLARLRKRPRAYATRYSRALGRRLRIGYWLRENGPLVPKLAQNRFHDSLNLLDSMKPHTAPATLFLASRGRGVKCINPDAGWTRLTGPSLEIVEVEGAHNSILAADVGGLAAALAEALERARARRVENREPAKD